MSYVLPPNNAISKLLDQNQPEDARAEITEVDRQLQLSDFNSTPEGSGPVRGWAGRGSGTSSKR